MSKPLNPRRDARIGPSRPLLGAVLAAVALVACSPSSEPKGDVGKGKAQDASAEVTIDDGAFDTDTLRLPTGEEVTVQLTNEDGSVHDFAIEALDINTGTIESGKTAYATFVVPQEPTEFVCTFHSGMKGTIEPQ